MSGQQQGERGAGGDAAGAAVAVAAAGWRLEPRADGGLDFIAADGTRHDDVELRRAFPLSAPRAGVAVLARGSGSELAWVASLDDAAPAVATLIEAVLARREVVPLIERIESISEGRPAAWSVLTDRGPRRFSVGQAEDVIRQPDGAVSISDTEGDRYRIPRPATLDARSRRLLERLR
jgi:hypothetical protein